MTLQRLPGVCLGVVCFNEEMLQSQKCCTSSIVMFVQHLNTLSNRLICCQSCYRPINWSDWWKCWRSFIWISNILLPPFTIDLHTSAVVCRDQLPQIKVTRLLHLYSEAFPVLASLQGVMVRLCQQIYLLKFKPLSCDTCSKSNRDVTTVWKRGVSYWMTLSYIGGKEWGVRTKVVIDWNILNDV